MLFRKSTGHAVTQLVGATSRKVASSIPDGVTGIFYRHNPSGRTIALGLTQPLTGLSNRNNSWGKGGRRVGLTTLPPSCGDCLEIWEPQPPGTLRGCPGLSWDYFRKSGTTGNKSIVIYSLKRPSCSVWVCGMKKSATKTEYRLWGPTGSRNTNTPVISSCVYIITQKSPAEMRSKNISFLKSLREVKWRNVRTGKWACALDLEPVLSRCLIY
jgi:hypothetical protein